MKTSILRVALLLAALVAPTAALSQSYPTKPITLSVPFPPSGTTDSIARALSAKLRLSLKQEFLIDNRPGAASLIALNHVRRQPADGYSLVLMSTTITTLPSLNVNADYTVERDFTPIAAAGQGSMMLVVNSETGIKTVADLIAQARASNKLTWGLASTLGFDHLGAMRIMRDAGINIETVGYKGNAPLALDLLANRVQVVLGGSMDLFGAHIKSGRLTLLGVSSEQRYAEFPNAPTLLEAGLKDSQISLWFGVFGPAGVPPTVVTLLNREINAAMQAPDLVERLATIGFTPLIMGPEKFAQLAYSSEKSWAATIKAMGVKPQ